MFFQNRPGRKEKDPCTIASVTGTGSNSAEKINISKEINGINAIQVTVDTRSQEQIIADQDKWIVDYTANLAAKRKAKEDEKAAVKKAEKEAKEAEKLRKQKLKEEKQAAENARKEAEKEERRLRIKNKWG